MPLGGCPLEWSRSLELFAPIGLTRVFIDSGNKAKGGSVYADGKRIVHFGLTGDNSPFGFPLMIPQNETERVLSEHLQNHGATIGRQVELVSFVEGPDSVVCQVRDADGHQESVEASWMIGCDGAHSAVRKGASMPFTGHAEPNDWMLAGIHIEGSLPEDEVSVFLHAKGALVFFPITRDRFRMIADLGKADALVQRADPTLADAQAKVDERGPGGLTLSNPVWLSNFRINERKVAEYRRGRIVPSRKGALRTIAAVHHQKNHAVATLHIRLIECRNGVVCDDREINCLLILGVRDVPNLEATPTRGISSHSRRSRASAHLPLPLTSWRARNPQYPSKLPRSSVASEFGC